MAAKFNPYHDERGRFASKPGGASSGSSGSSGGASTDSAEFKAWFGESKVVDDDGKPLIVHHGTTKDFTEFSNSNNAHAQMLGFPAHFFTDNTAVASTYAPGEQGKLVSAYLKIERPLEIDANGAEWHEAMGQISDKLQTYRTPKEKEFLDYKREVSEKYRYEIEFEGGLPDKVQAEFSARAKEMDQHILNNLGTYMEAKRQPHHYDGIIIKNALDMTANPVNERLHGGASYNPYSTQYVVFKPNQIKSASKNSGKFDPDSGDFTKNLTKDYNPGQARVPAGSPTGGQWTSMRSKAQAGILAKVDSALAAGDPIFKEPLKDEQKAQYRAAFASVLDGMNDKAVLSLADNLEGVDFYPSAQWLTHKVTQGRPQKASGNILGAWSYDPGTGKGRLHLDGGFSGKTGQEAIKHVYAHEISHAIDWAPLKWGTGSGAISGTAHWIDAFNSEIMPAPGKESALSKYATTNAGEGWAEFGRLAITAPSLARWQFPKCYEVWERHGYSKLPATAAD